MTNMNHNKLKIDIGHLAILASLEITPKQKKKLRAQLEETIKYIGILNQLNTENIQPTAQVNNLSNVSREDKKGGNLPQKEALVNAKRKRLGYFMTERVKWE